MTLRKHFVNQENAVLRRIHQRMSPALSMLCLWVSIETDHESFR